MDDLEYQVFAALRHGIFKHMVARGVTGEFTTQQYIDAVAEATISRCGLPLELARSQLADSPNVLRLREDLWMLI